LRLPAVAVISLHQLANLLSSRFYTSFEFYPHAAGAIKALWAWTRAIPGPRPPHHGTQRLRWEGVEAGVDSSAAGEQRDADRSSSCGQSAV